jgi:cation diffusion facilitator CzcD-associated flavoprotein CzcO
MVKAVWEEHDKKWTVTTKEGGVFRAQFLLPAHGPLNHARMPDIQGLDTFEGPAFHTALWRKDVDFTKKRVAVIGTAATSVQLIPAIAETVKDLYVFQRHATWVPALSNPKYGWFTQMMYAVFPPLMYLHRWILFFWVDHVRHNFLDPEKQHETEQYRDNVIKHYMKTVKDPKLAKALIPVTPIGKGRVCPSAAFLQTFNKPNVHLITDHISQITKNGIQTHTQTIEDIDIIVLATGFNTQKYHNSFVIEGKDERILHEEWNGTPSAYKGITYPGFPNLFLLYGPNTCPNQGALHTSIV